MYHQEGIIQKIYVISAKTSFSKFLRYYRSGVEMVRMANVYLEEGSLEDAYVLYLKFMTLFIEKIRKHPDFASVPENVRAMNSEKLREVLPKCEKLKAKLVDTYTKDYNQFLTQQVCFYSNFIFYFNDLFLFLSYYGYILENKSRTRKTTTN